MWSTIELAGHACEVFEPTQPSEHQYVIVYLHGVSGEWLNDKPAFTEQFERFGLRVIGPRTQRSWWSDRICDEFDMQKTAESFVKDDVMCHIQDHWGVTTPRVALLGTSMGGQGALRLSYKYPGLFPVVAAISPAIDYHLRMKQGIDETLLKCMTIPRWLVRIPRCYIFIRSIGRGISFLQILSTRTGLKVLIAYR